MAEKGKLFLVKAPAVGITVTFTNGTNIVNLTSHAMVDGDSIILTNSGGALPAELAVDTLYYVGDAATNSFTLHTTKAAGLAGTGDIAITDNGTGTSTIQRMDTLAGLRSNQFAIDGELVDITDKDSTGEWRELGAAFGESKMSLSGSGLFQDDLGVTRLRVVNVSRALDTYSFQFESGDEYYGLFQVTSMEHAGEHNDALTYSCSFESKGPITQITNA